MKKLFGKKGFTIVELIVVITILSILGTIGFISYTSYSSQARNTSRISDISSLSRLLDYYKGEFGRYPLPDNAIPILASGSIVGYQGDIGLGVSRTIKYATSGKDQKDESFYPYYILKDGLHRQSFIVLEGGYNFLSGVTPSYADEKNIQLYGENLGILTDMNLVPAHKEEGITHIDLIKTNKNYIAHISEKIQYSGTGETLRYATPLSSCQRLMDAQLAGKSGYYTLNFPDGSTKEVYCNFDAPGLGLTLIARSVDNTLYNNTPFGWFIERGSPQDDSQPYSLGSKIRDIPFQKVYMTVYSTGKVINGTTSLEVRGSVIEQNQYASGFLNVLGCQGVSISPTQTSCALFSKWGKFNNTTSYWFSNTQNNITDGLNARRFGSTFPYPGMIFVQ